MRVETKTWGLSEDDLDHDRQMNVLNIIDDTDKYKSTCLSHIRTKLSGYRQQDILKKKLDEEKKQIFYACTSVLNEGKNAAYKKQRLLFMLDRIKPLMEMN